jgi:Ferritin-like
VFVVKDLADVCRAIDLIRRQGEGSNASPEEMPGHLAHFYQFRELYVGSKYVRNPATKTWGHTGPPVLIPAVWPMADIPSGGYQRADVPDGAVWALIEQFDSTFTTMLRQLRRAWQDPTASLGNGAADDPIFTTMFALTGSARELMQKSRPDGNGTYGPCFRIA